MPPFAPSRRRVITRVLMVGAISALAVFALATRDTVALLAAVVAFGALISVLSVEVVVLRRRLAAVQRRVATAHERSDELKRSAKALAAEMPKQWAAATATELLNRGDVMDAYRLVSTADAFNVLSWENLRSLRKELSDRGYLRDAHNVGTLLAEWSGTASDRGSRDSMAAYIAVLSGRFRPTIAPEATGAANLNRVLHVVAQSILDSESGYSIRTHYSARAQSKAGLDPQVVSLNGSDQPASEQHVTELDGVAYHESRGPYRGSVTFDQWLQMNAEFVADVVRDVRPAILHAASDFSVAMVAESVGRAFGIPVIYESRGFWEETWLSRQAQKYGWSDLDHLEATYGLPDTYRWRRELEDECRRRADRVITLADVMADRIVAGGVDPQRVSVVPNAVSVDLFPRLSRDEGLAEQLRIPASTTVIGYISSIVEYEGVDTLISAFSRVSVRATEPTVLLVVGDGLELENLRQMAAERGLGPSEVIFTGRVPHDEVLRYYSLIDVFVVPRKPAEVCHLVTPLKPFEAFSTGRTVVVSDVRALASLAEESQAAALFEAGNPGSLADVLVGLLADPVRRRDLAEAGALWVRAERTWEHNADLYMKVYEELGVVAAETN